jgi:hypothetical protein
MKVHSKRESNTACGQNVVLVIAATTTSCRCIRGVAVYRYACLASAVDGGGWPGLFPGCFTTWERATQLSPRDSLDEVKKKKTLVLSQNRTPIRRPFSCYAVTINTKACWPLVALIKYIEAVVIILKCKASLIATNHGTRINIGHLIVYNKYVLELRRINF